MNEPRDTPLDEGERWLRLAHEDLLTARTILDHQDSALRNVGTYRLVLGRQPVIEPDEVSVSVRIAAEHSVVEETLSLTEDTTLVGPIP